MVIIIEVYSRSSKQDEDQLSGEEDLRIAPGVDIKLVKSREY